MHRALRNVPWPLVLNFDQLWKSSYEPPKRVLHKRKATQAKQQGEDWGEVTPDDLLGKRLDAVLSLVEGEMTKRMGQTDKASKLRKSAARSEFVEGGRKGITAVTSTWANGEMGPLGICTATGSLPLSFIRSINEAYRGHVFIFESGTESHFMNANTTLLYLEHLIAPASRLENSSNGRCNIYSFSLNMVLGVFHGGV